MTEQHPIAPPNILLNQWESDWFNERENVDALLTQAYQAGADAELQACCEWFVRDWTDVETADKLRAARRGKHPSLAEEALEAQKRLWCGMSTHDDWHLIRRALERLQELENNQ